MSLRGPKFSMEGLDGLIDHPQQEEYLRDVAEPIDYRNAHDEIEEGQTMSSNEYTIALYLRKHHKGTQGLTSQDVMRMMEMKYLEKTPLAEIAEEFKTTTQKVSEITNAIKRRWERWPNESRRYDRKKI